MPNLMLNEHSSRLGGNSRPGRRTESTDIGFAVTVTVVDQRAQPRVQLMKEGAFPHTIDNSSRKAITAASRREATAVIEAENEHEPTLGAVFNEIGLITLSGGIPILHGGAVIGGIGIAGSPGEDATGKEFDDVCAEAGIAAIAHHLNEDKSDWQ
ncbi:MAG: heme-binding protein [Pseudomonadota bacterium]